VNVVVKPQEEAKIAVIPAKAGIHFAFCFKINLDSRFRGNED
jgi:hypothetical protein